MTQEEKADMLLCAAKHWQNGYGVRDWDCPCSHFNEASDIAEDMEEPSPCPGPSFTWASCALSEVAALGFDLETVAATKEGG